METLPTLSRLSSEWLIPSLPSTAPFLQAAAKVNLQPRVRNSRCRAAADDERSVEESHAGSQTQRKPQEQQRRKVLWSAAIGTPAVLLANAWQLVPPAEAARRSGKDFKVPESEYQVLPSGLKVYDVTVGKGPLASRGSRVAVHYVAKWKGITFMTRRVAFYSGSYASRAAGKGLA
eukprot:TRINITY_DN17117_c0_g1_i2.p1 TRINITY_DN17117_c0_g1~~TRINITY_DN17117_c0_g1_i2.p1  ORF type:complete len:176 (+),score=27.93 TRINITY_DN17117_c0_g1_i2:195-722(+)